MPKKKSSDKAETTPGEPRKVKGSDKDKRLANLKPFEPGVSGNPEGKKIGTRNRRTVILAALLRIGEKKNLTAEEVEEAIQVAGIEKALKGSFFHFQEISNGLYGKIKDEVDINHKGKTYADLMLAAANARKRKSK